MYACVYVCMYAHLGEYTPEVVNLTGLYEELAELVGRDGNLAQPRCGRRRELEHLDELGHLAGSDLVDGDWDGVVLVDDTRDELCAVVEEGRANMRMGTHTGMHMGMHHGHAHRHAHGCGGIHR